MKQKTTREKNRTQCVNNTIQEWSRPGVFDSNRGNLKIDEAGFERFYATMKKQIDQRFNKKTNVSAAEREDAMGLGLRSSQPKDDSFFDNDALVANTTNHKRLSRYHWEDLLHLNGGDNVVIMVSTLQKWMKTTKMKLAPWHAAKIQREAGIAGEEQVIAGEKFYALKARVVSQSLSHEAKAGDITYENFQKAFANKGGGISLRFTGTNITHAFPWSFFVDQAERFYCFGPPLESSRR